SCLCPRTTAKNSEITAGKQQIISGTRQSYFFRANPPLFSFYRLRFQGARPEKIIRRRVEGGKAASLGTGYASEFRGGLGKKSAKRRGRLRGACRRLSRRS